MLSIREGRGDRTALRSIGWPLRSLGLHSEDGQAERRLDVEIQAGDLFQRAA